MTGENSSDRPYLGRTLATLAALFSLAATALSGVGAWYANQASEQSQATQAALEQSKLVKDYQIKVFEIVDKSLSQAQGGLVLASAYASSLDDQKLQTLVIQAIRVVALSRQKTGALTQEEAAALQVLTEATRQADVTQIENAPNVTDTTKAAAAIVNPLSQNGVTEAQLNRKAINPIGWDVDVFWCVSRGDPSQQLADAIARDLADKADAGTPLSGQPLGRIRVRQLTDAAADRGNLPKDTNEVRADIGEESMGDALVLAASAKATHPFFREKSGTSTR